MLRISLISGAVFLLASQAGAVTHFSATQCQGSAMPYPAPARTVAAPDSLTAVMVNHVGRHGARYLTSSKQADKVLDFLAEAEKLGSLTPLGQQLRTLSRQVMELSQGRWGTLDTLGMAEQAGIASRMCDAYPELVKGATVEALSSYVPRCIMSMDCFTHEISRRDNDITIYTSSGRVNSPLVRPFDLDSAYLDYVSEEPYHKAYKDYYDSLVPTSPASRLSTAQLDAKKLRDGSFAEYRMLSGLNAMGLDVDLTQYFTVDELNALWSVHNLDQYLVRVANCYSTVPADITAALLHDLIATTDQVIAGKSDAHIQLRFGHAETMMPLLSLMRLPGCYYVSDDLSTVSSHWQSFNVVPMASNLQLKLFRGPSGRYYVRADLNEKPVPLIEGRDDMYVPWDEARTYLNAIVERASLAL